MYPETQGTLGRITGSFDPCEMPHPEQYWSSLITYMVNHGQFNHALNLYKTNMKTFQSLCDGYTFVALLKACAQLKDVGTGSELHANISGTRLLESDIFVGNALIDMYSKCGLMNKAQEVFDSLPARDVISWTSLIAGYSKHNFAEKAMECYDQMQLTGIIPNAITYVCILKACGTSGDLDMGFEIHSEICRNGLLEKNLFLGSALIDMYAKCAISSRAEEIFNRFTARDTILWNTLIAGYADNDEGYKALHCYEMMQFDGFNPDIVTFISILKACAATGAIHKGQELHIKIAQSGLLKKEIEIENALIDMYAKCGSLNKAHKVFQGLPLRDEISWNTMIAGYTNHEDYEEAMSCVEQMQVEGFSSTDVTLVSLLDACSNIEDVKRGKKLHAEIIHRNLLKDNSAIGSAVIDMYAKCGLVDKAKEVFDKLSARNVILWTTLIAGYVQQEFAKDALDCLEKMVLEGISPNNVTYACSLKACTILGATCKGGELHAQAARSSLFKQDTTLQRTLVEMYAKSGLLSKAHEVFNTLSARDLSSWNTLMAGYAHLGDSANVLQIFEKLKRDGLQPDLSSFSHLLSVCSITGMLHSAHMFLHSMDDDYSMTPTIEHYTAIIDLYGRLGYVDMARFLVKQLPFDPDNAVWHTLLDACHRWGDLG
ncbi:hypothetical protein KP509_34G058900 [Ceratopteris richardii]|nr:hypothetical protein KP509_34G058900 [Ceratopteris richardii]